MEEEIRAFPDFTDKDIHFTSFQCIGSPVSAKQMNRATDADLLNLFNELTDDLAWDHPRHSMKGGAIQAGRELAELAKSNLAKVLRIIKALDPGRNEIPVSCALRELVPAGLTVPAFYSLVSELEDRGFVGPNFRHDAAYAIKNAANSETPVPDELLDRMERWLVSSAAEDASEIEVESEDDFSAVLWGHVSMITLPDGNYPVLSALTSACLMAEPPRLKRWLSILERHISRSESLHVWEVMIQRELRNLHMADRSSAEALVDQLIASVPSIVNRRGWADFVGHAFQWASSTAVRRWLMGIVQGGGGFQGAGELACLRHAFSPAEEWARELVWTLCRDHTSAAALGVAHSVANLWHKPMARQVVHPMLLQLLGSEDDRVLTALSAIFLNDGFAADVETRELLDALIAYPKILKNGRAEHLPEILARLVAYEPERICQVVNLMIDVAGDQMGNIATSWYLRSEWLLDIALQLQDMGEVERVAGSVLFERMLEFNIPQAREMTLDLDKRTPVGNSRKAPRRHRSRARVGKLKVES